MYISVRDRPAAGEHTASAPRPPPVGRVVITLGMVSPADRRLLGVGRRDPAALPHRGRRPLARGVRPHRRPLPGRQRAGPPRRRLAAPTPRTARSGSPSSATACPPSRASSCSSPPARPAIAAVVTADRIGKGIRTAPRDAMISTADADRAPRPRLRRAPHARHHRRRARAADRVRPAGAGARRLLRRARGLAGLRPRSAWRCSASSAPTSAPGATATERGPRRRRSGGAT